MAKYAYQNDEENTAKALGKEIPISPKRAYEVANFIRGREVSKARGILEKVIELKQAVPFKRHNKGVAHRKGKIAGGAYPVKACGEFLKLLTQVEANAAGKGLNTSALKLEHVAVHRGRITAGRFKGGAHNTPTVNLEYVVKEGAAGPRSDVDAKKPKAEKEKPKAENKKEEKKEPKTEKKEKK